MKSQKRLFPITLVLLSLCSLASYIKDTDYWIVDILSQFPAQYALASLFLFFAGLWKKHIPLAVLAASLSFFNISTVIDFDKPLHAAGQVKSGFKVYSANLHIDNKDLEKLKKEVNEIGPEMVLLLEVTPEHLVQLRPLINNYPHYIENIFKGERDIGFVFLSKFPILENHITRLSDVCNFVLETRLEINQQPVKFYGVHAQRPDVHNLGERKEQFIRLAQQLREQTLPVIVAGDFNATPYSPMFREVVKISGLKDSREGFGWQPSWPTFFPLLWIPIDHVLVTPDVQVLMRRTGSYIGSDHYPVITKLSLTM